jgi:nicotinate phosphoribosyltransferase
MSVDDAGAGLLTDYYQLTMLAAYHELGLDAPAVFEFFLRRLPPQRGFVVAAGLPLLLEYLETLAFRPPEIDWLQATGRFNAGFLKSLAASRFRGDVDAVPEGTVMFPDEPIVRISARLPEAQLIESRLINLLHFSTLIASKAARCVLAAGGRPLIDFGMRRAHGAEAAVYAARAAYLAGFTGTATVAAARRFAIPVFGTMAHSFIEAHDVEADAFENFARSQPDNVTLLIDTYDPVAATKSVAKLAQSGTRIAAVRIDSGDPGQVARDVRRILDAGGCPTVRIVASSSLDEWRIAQLVREGAPIDAFGVGTRLDVSADVPALDCVYKLQEYAGRPRRKRSPDKATWPGRKQVFRSLDAAGRLAGDLVALEGESRPGAPLLVPVMREGRRLSAPEPLELARARVASELASLPAALRELEVLTPYRVTLSERIRALAAEVDARS